MYRTFLISMEHLDLELTDSLSSLLHRTANLCKEIYRRGLGFSKNIDMIGGHSLLRNQHFLRTVDDKVSSRVIGAFIEVVEILVL